MSTERWSAERRALVAFLPGTIVLRTLLAAVGVDGGPIFQILAIDDLGLTSRQLGIAFGVGVLSVPLQIAAARIPLRRARRNSQLFFAMLAVLCLTLAVLVAGTAGGSLAVIALAVAVLAELGVSILYAPSWQPMMSVALSGRRRQRLNSQWRGVSRGVLALGLILFGSLGGWGRAGFLGVCGVLAALSAISLFGLAELAPVDGSTQAGPTIRAGSDRRRYRRLLTVAAVVNLGALPLWLVYLKTSLWPQANLGVVGGVQAGATLMVFLGWRASEGDLTRRVRLGTVALVAGAIAVALLGGPVDTTVQIALVYAITIVVTSSVTVIDLVLLEELHRETPATESVRVFTMLDVVESTGLQVGLVAAGFLILPTTTVPYRAFVLASAVLTALAVRLAWYAPGRTVPPRRIRAE